ncbi:MAG: hypothetical protein ACYC26_11085 [Phycisphaerales bacterium]
MANEPTKRPKLQTRHDAYMMRVWCAAVRQACGNHHLAELFAVQLWTCFVNARRKNMTFAYFTHTKCAKMRGRQHRNTTRAMWLQIVSAGLVSMSDDRFTVAMAGAYIANGARAPGFNAHTHVTAFRIDGHKLAELAQTYRPLTSTVSEQGDQWRGKQKTFAELERIRRTVERQMSGWDEYTRQRGRGGLRQLVRPDARRRQVMDAQATAEARQRLIASIRASSGE